MNNEIAKAVQSDEPTSVACVDEYQQQLNKRRIELQERINSIMPAGHDPMIWMGRERQEVTEAGDIGRVKALDDEFQALRIEQDQVKHLLARLREIRKASEVREAIESMPQWFEQLGRECEAVVAAHHALMEAWDKAEATYSDILRGRMKAQASYLDASGADDKVMRKIGSAVACYGGERTTLKLSAVKTPNTFARDIGFSSDVAA